MRPPSYRIQVHKQACSMCRHAYQIEFQHDLLCFHGDKYRVHPSVLREGSTEWCVELQGPGGVWSQVGLLDPHYERAREERTIVPEGICESYEARVPGILKG